MTYFVEGLLKLNPGESRIRRFGEYETLEGAISAAEQMIDEFLITRFEAGMTAEGLFSIYQECGEVPYIFRDDARTLNVAGFNHFKHAMLRCNVMCPKPFPSLISDDEFEALTQQRHHGERSEHDRWDNRGIRKKPDLTDGRPESTIEQRYAYVAQRIIATWPSEACATYIRLVMSDGALREEFPKEVIDDLLMLYEINKMRLVKN